MEEHTRGFRSALLLRGLAGDCVWQHARAPANEWNGRCRGVEWSLARMQHRPQLIWRGLLSPGLARFKAVSSRWCGCVDRPGFGAAYLLHGSGVHISRYCLFFLSVILHAAGASFGGREDCAVSHGMVLMPRRERWRMSG